MRRTILVVDDDRSMVRTLCDIFRLRGWDPHPAYSGEEAVAAQCGTGFGAGLMDFRMQGMDGLTAFKSMKLCTPDVRVVLMTAHTAPEMVDDAARAGALRVMPKPVDLNALLSLLEN